MTQFGPASTFVFVGGKNVSADMMQLDDHIEQKTENTRGFSVAWDEHKPIGVASVAVEATGGFYDTDTAKLVAALQGMGATRQIWGYGIEGMDIGAKIQMMDGLFAARFNRIAQMDALTKANAKYTCSGQMYSGVILNFVSRGASGNTEATSVDQNNVLHRPTVAITSSSVANPTVITAPGHGLITGDVILIANHSGSTPSLNGQHTVTVTGDDTFTIPVNVSGGGTGGTLKKLVMTGAIADLHVPALTLGGYDSVTINVRGSADNITFADLGAFSDITTVGTAQRISIAGQIPRYLAISWLWNGSGSGAAVTPYVTIST